MPVEPSQVITEESSEECDYDEDYDYSDEVTDSPEKMYSITEVIIFKIRKCVMTFQF